MVGGLFEAIREIANRPRVDVPETRLERVVRQTIGENLQGAIHINREVGKEAASVEITRQGGVERYVFQTQADGRIDVRKVGES
jgi:hypothetical protein